MDPNAIFKTAYRHLRMQVLLLRAIA